MQKNLVLPLGIYYITKTLNRKVILFMVNKLTKSFVDNLPFTTEKGKQLFYYDSEQKGFGLKVGNTAKTYIAETKVGKKNVRIILGKHDVLTVELARKLAKNKLATIKKPSSHPVAFQGSNDREQTLIDFQQVCERFANYY